VARKTDLLQQTKQKQNVTEKTQIAFPTGARKNAPKNNN
jgi:hypothetical protein